MTRWSSITAVTRMGPRHCGHWSGSVCQACLMRSRHFLEGRRRGGGGERQERGGGGGKDSAIRLRTASAATDLVAVEAIIADHLAVLVGNVLGDGGQEVGGGKDLEVALDFNVHAGAVDDHVAGGLEGHLVHGEGVAEDVLDEFFQVCFGFGADAVAGVDVEAAMFPGLDGHDDAGDAVGEVERGAQIVSDALAGDGAKAFEQAAVALEVGPEHFREGEDVMAMGHWCQNLARDKGR